tara:strand:+ start:65616 stop:66134 length:519 start_codon:yes stop_codon:yes gene_type:complete
VLHFPVSEWGDSASVNPVFILKIKDLACFNTYFQNLTNMTDLSQLNYLAIFVAAFSAFLVGGVWYSPILFAKSWMKENNFTDDDLKSGQGKIFGTAFVLELIMAFNLAAFIGAESDITFGLIAGFLAGFGWVALGMGVTYLFERKSFRLWAINAGYQVVSFTVMGGIVGVWH